MEGSDLKLMEKLLDLSLSNEYLDNQIKSTSDLKLLKILLNFKYRRLSKCEKITLPIDLIYKQDIEDIDLQCEVLKAVFLIIENCNTELLNILKYLNYEAKHCLKLPTATLRAKKIVRILNETMLICKSQNKDFFHNKLCTDNIHKFLLYILMEKNNSLRTYVLSSVLQNYLSLLSELDVLSFILEIFLQSKACQNLEVLCTIFHYVDSKTFLKYEDCSILFMDDFWIFLERAISLDNNTLAKQGVYLLKTIIEVYLKNCSVLQSTVPFLTTIKNMPVVDSKNIWQDFFILLDASKEKQLHLVWPSLKLLYSLKYLNILWQICIYKLLLKHTQNSVVYFTALHILEANIFLPGLSKHFLFAINKNDYCDHSIQMYEALPLFCNNLKDEQFIHFLENLLEVKWTPTALWCLFKNVFSSKLKKTISLRIFVEIHKLAKRLPHIYIRNGCIKVFLDFYVSQYKWNHNYEESCKVLSIVREYSKDLFVYIVLNYMDRLFLNYVVNQINSIVINNSYTFDVKIFQVFVQLVKLLKCQEGLELIVKNIANFSNVLVAVVYANLIEYCNTVDVETFVKNKLADVNEDWVETYLQILYNLMKSNNHFNEQLYIQMLNILIEPNNYNNQCIISVAFYVIVNFYRPHDNITKIVENWRYNFLNGSVKTDDNVVIFVIDLFFLANKYPDRLFLDYIVNTQSDVAITRTFEQLASSSSHLNCHDLVYILKLGPRILQNLTKSSCFKRIVSSYIDIVFSLDLFETLCNLGMLNIISSTIYSLLELCVTFPIVSYYLSKKLNNFIVRCDNSSYYPVLIPAIVELLLQGTVIKKEERVEYNVCQEIYINLGDTEHSSNMRKISTTMSSLESMLNSVNKRESVADNFVSCLIEKYKVFFNKRYFPDSQIHLQKLRIIQALLTIHPFITAQRQVLIDLIMDSFCVEIHQPCVKQLMQWLLYLLVKDESTIFSLITAKINNTTKTQPSSIASLIVVLLHLTLSKPESFWLSAAEVLLPWCMGAHFKLRVYSQAAVRKLCEEASQKSYKNFLSKYSFLEKCVNCVIEASGQAFYDTLKSDELFLFKFDPARDYSLQTIYVDIPKLNNVTKTEWENILHYEFSFHENIDILNRDKTLSNIIKLKSEQKCEQIITNIFENGHNIQRKITPWKIMLEEEGDKEFNNFIIIASLITKPTNLGGLSRTCEVFGVKQIILNDTKIISDKSFKSLSMSSESWVDTMEVKIADLKSFILEIKAKGYCVIGAEQTSESICLNEYKFKERTALLLGNEKEGIPPDLIPILDACVEIPQFGVVRSLNVHVAGATFIWEYVKQHSLK